MLVKLLGKTSIKYNPKLLDQAKQSATMHLKLIEKEQFKKQLEQQVI